MAKARKTGKKAKQGKRPFYKTRAFKISLIALAVCIVLAFAATILLNIYVYADDVVVMYVDGYPVTREEFKFYMEMERQYVVSYFAQAHGTNLSGNDWERSFNGERPIEVLRDRTVLAVTETKSLQILALEHGVTEDINYEAMKTGLREINEDRLEQEAAGEILYGPTEFIPYTYYQQVISNFKVSVKEKVENSSLFVEEQQIRDLYMENYEVYNNTDNITVLEMFIPYLPPEATPNENVSIYQDEAIYLMEVAYDRLLAGEDFQMISEEFTGLEPEEYTLHVGEQSRPAGGTADLIARYADGLSPGEISQPFRNGFGFSVLKMLDPETEVNMSFDEAAPYLYNILIQDRFEEFLIEQAAAREVVIRDFVFNTVS